MPTKIEISFRTILNIVLLLIGLWLIYYLRDIVILFFVVLVFVASISPVVDNWATLMPRTLAIVLIFIGILLLIAIIGILIIPPVVEQIQNLAQNLPNILSKYFHYNNFPSYTSWSDFISSSQQGLLSISSQLSKIGISIFSTVTSFLSGLVIAFTILVLTFYLLLEEKVASRYFLSFVSEKNKEKFAHLVQKIADKMGRWLRGQLLLMLIVGVLDLIILLTLGVDYALVLALWAGLTEIIPYLGPWLGGAPAVLIAILTGSPLKGLLVFILYLAVQQIEAQFLVPKIMQRAVGLSPVVIILAILIGAKLMGVLGILLAVPIAAVISVIVQEYMATFVKKEKEAT